MNIEIITKRNCKGECKPSGLSVTLGLKSEPMGGAIDKNIAGIIIYLAFCQLVIFCSDRDFSNFLDEKIIMEYSFVKFPT
jgi:hypothetical protein